jgi:AGCS family alanine or glycine:cation symporter
MIGCAIKLDAVLDFSDAMVFAMALANLIGRAFMAPGVRQGIKAYWRRMEAREADAGP